MIPGDRSRQLLALLTAVLVLGLAVSSVGWGTDSSAGWQVEVDPGIDLSIPSMPSVAVDNSSDRLTPRPGISPLPTVPVDDEREETTPDSSFDSFAGGR